MREQNAFILEIHYGTAISALSVDTRNICSNTLVNLINELFLSLYGTKEFEMEFLPAEVGCYQDKILCKLKKGSSSVITTANLLLLILGIPRAYYEISAIQHENEIKKFEIANQETDKCLEWIEKIEGLRNKGIEISLSDNEINRVCKNVKIEKYISRFYNALDKNEKILNQRFVFSDDEGYKINEISVHRKDFQTFIKNNIEIYNGFFKDVHFEIISPVIKSVKGAKFWTGEYKGNSLSDEGIPLIENGEIVHFYMSDDNFKKEINNQEISFKQGDIIVGNIRINGKIREDFSISHRKIWIESVEKYNNEEREAFKKKNDYDTLGELPLFSGKSK